MVISTKFDGNQKKFHWYWLPLMYKHPECTFFVSGEFIFPKDISNLIVNEKAKGGPLLECPMNKVPSYSAMIELQKKRNNWKGTSEDLKSRFYEV